MKAVEGREGLHARSHEPREQAVPEARRTVAALRCADLLWPAEWLTQRLQPTDEHVRFFGVRLKPGRAGRALDRLSRLYVGDPCAVPVQTRRALHAHDLVVTDRFHSSLEFGATSTG